MRARIRFFLEELTLSRTLRTYFNTGLSALLVLTALFVACKGEEELAEPEAFSFVVYPGSRYLGQITENIKGDHITFEAFDGYHRGRPKIDRMFIKYFGFSQATSRALGGTSVLIVVGVALDTMRQMESQMMMRHYEGFLR